MEFAGVNDIDAIMELYSAVVTHVNKTTVRLGWNTSIYPSYELVKTAVSNGEMLVVRDGKRIVAAAVVNHEVNPEYDEIDWQIKGPAERIATIHALAVLPETGLRGSKVSYPFLAGIEDLCRRNGDLAIHLDVIDSNVPAYKLYTRNGYHEIACIKMFYEVVGVREFWMLEKVL